MRRPVRRTFGEYAYRGGSHSPHDDQSGATRLDDLTELLEHRSHTEQVDAKDRVDVGLLGSDTRGMNEIGDRSEHRDNAPMRTPAPVGTL
jgi:hypothetical protein